MIPTTPHKPKLQSPLLESTPNSKYSASNYSSDVNHTREHREPFLRQDLDNAETCTIDQWVKAIFGLETGWRNDTCVSEIAQNVTICDHFLAFQNLVLTSKDELARYPHIVRLFNFVWAELALKKKDSPLKITITRNDKKIVLGSAAQRKPDLVVVESVAVNLPKRNGVEAMMASGPTESPFWWPELLGFLEVECPKQGE
jgi:hypothetical protein